MGGKETDISLTVEAIIASSCSTILIFFFFKSSIRELEDEKVWVTTLASFCWLSRIFERAWYYATTFSTCPFKERYEVGDPEVDLLGELIGKFDYYVLYPRNRKQKIAPPPCKEIMIKTLNLH